MSTIPFTGQTAEVLCGSADSLEGYIAREDTIDQYIDLFIRLNKKSRSPNYRTTGGYKAFVLAHI